MAESSDGFGSRLAGTVETTRVSVVIVTYNDRPNLLRCLRSLADQTIPSSATEIVVVDDGSTDGTADAVARSFPDVCIVGKTNEGADISRNAGVVRASGGIIAFIDSDCTAAVDWLARLVERLTANERAVVGGRVEHRGTFWQRVTGVADFGEYQSLRERAACALPTCNLGLRRELARSEPFDPRLARAGGDTLLTERLRRGGAELIYAPEVLVRHCPRVGPAEFFARGRRYGRSFVKARRLEPDLRYGAFVRAGAVGVVAATLGRVVIDWYRLVRHRRTANIRRVELPAAAMMLGLRRLFSLPAALAALKVDRPRDDP